MLDRCHKHGLYSVFCRDCDAEVLASETPRETPAQNPTDIERRETDYSDVPTGDHFDAIERAVPPSRFDNFEEI